VMRIYRQAIQALIDWKRRSDRKPLLIRGARQVGKTWLMKEFGKTEYRKCAYINFDSNDRMQRLFGGDLDVSRIITGLQIEADCVIEPENTLVIFDEVQECPKALAALKYFCENAPQYHVLAAGSLLGVALHSGTSFPVGKVEFLDLHPLSFPEFLRALDRDDLLKLISDKEYELVTTFKDKYIDLLRQYYFIGGMPEAVAAFSQNQDFSRVREIQNRILAAYEQDFSKHVPVNTVTRLRVLWNSIPSQLAKENRKFIYGLIRQGARAKEYELALTWLCDCGFVYKVGRVNKPSMPLKAYEDLHSFKLFVLDVGLLGAMVGLDKKTLLDGNKILQEFKGALTEQYVLQQLKAINDLPVFYWSAETGEAEVDFLIQLEGNVVPIEVKAEENLQAKSLKSYYKRYAPEFSVRTSMSDFRIDDWLTNIPLYMIGSIKDIIQRS
jgi:predicted AAA+ superfamily ATPase